MLRRSLLGLALCLAVGCADPIEHVCRNIILPEQRTIAYRDPAQLPRAPLPDLIPPRTVSDPRPQTPEWRLSLDEAIRIALENTRVVRMLSGTTATSSGRTIYDAAIINTTIDQAQARFDPVLSNSSAFNHTDAPTAAFNPFNPSQALIYGIPTEDFTNVLGLTKTNVLGGQWSLNWNLETDRFQVPALLGAVEPLNPQTQRSVTLSYTQPLLQGGGFLVNKAPIVIARLNTEQSFFQYKDSVEELVRGVIEAYWNLVLSRIQVWAVGIQVEESEKEYKREKYSKIFGLKGAKDEAQARVTYEQFRASKVAADADVLQREGALRNLLMLPPEDGRKIVPVSVPTNRRLKSDWDELIHLAEQRRPDIVELKIVLEADRVRLLQAKDQTLPTLNTSFLYRWNGLSGEMPNGEYIDSGMDHFGAWSLTVNFSVPLGLRRAGPRCDSKS